MSNMLKVQDMETIHRTIQGTYSNDRARDTLLNRISQVDVVQQAAALAPVPIDK